MATNTNNSPRSISQLFLLVSNQLYDDDSTKVCLNVISTWFLLIYLSRYLDQRDS